MSVFSWLETLRTATGKWDILMAPSCSKADGLCVSRSLWMVIERDNFEHFWEVLSDDRLDWVDNNSFLLSFDVRLPSGARQVSLAPGQHQQQQWWRTFPIWFPNLKINGNFFFRCLRLLLLAMKIMNRKKPCNVFRVSVTALWMQNAFH